jgi:hypothetical protein
MACFSNTSLWSLQGPSTVPTQWQQLAVQGGCWYSGLQSGSTCYRFKAYIDVLIGTRLAGAMLSCRRYSICTCCVQYCTLVVLHSISTGSVLSVTGFMQHNMHKSSK